MMYRILINLSFIIFLLGCGAKNIETAVSPEVGKYPLKAIAVVPFGIGGEKRDRESYKSYEVASYSRELITGLFYDRLKSNFNYALPSSDEAGAVLKELEEKGIGGDAMAQQLGERLDADAVLTGTIAIFEERVGTPLGVERPASVSFEARLIRAKDGVVLWSGRYYETQKSLTEDIGQFFIFLKRRGKWLTARQLAEYGVDEVLKTFPSRQ